MKSEPPPRTDKNFKNELKMLLFVFKGKLNKYTKAPVSLSIADGAIILSK